MITGSGYFDLQVNGFAGVDLNSDGLTADALHRACVAIRQTGVTGFLATVITEDLDIMIRRIGRIVSLCEHDALAEEMIAGFHVEGPFINPLPGYVGAHPRDAVIPASRDAAERLVDACAGRLKVFTLAPECDAGLVVTRWLAQRGIVVSSGHSNADLPTLSAAVDAGLSMYTHLGNGCPMELPRHDNIVQRVLSLADRIRIGFIADGAHVALFALKNYFRVAGIENCFVVSDAMSAAGLGPGTYQIGRHAVAVGEDRVARSPDGSHLIGSAVTLDRSAELLRSIGCTTDQIQQLLVVNPRKALGLGERK